VGHHILEFHADQERANEFLARAARGQAISEFECRLRCADGSLLHVALDCNRGSGDGANGALCFTRDISRQRVLENNLRDRAYQLERTLNQNELLLAQLNALLECASAGFAFLDFKLRYQRVNPFLAALHGAPVEAHAGRRPSEVLATGGEDLEDAYA